MTDTPRGTAPAADPADPATAVPARAGARHEALRRRLGLAAVVACLPYLTLKLLWVLGIDVGVVDLHGTGRGTWVLVNLVTFLMDAAAALIAYLLTRPGGPRVRTWLLALPMWMASGLLSVIMIAVPLDAARPLFGGPNPFRDQDGFLQPWVYGVVYGGFIVEGAVLMGAFGLYLHDRHGPLLRTPAAAFARRLPLPVRTAALAAAGLLAATGAVRLAWACGARFGLTAARLAEMDGTARLTQGVQAVLALAAAVGTVVAVRGLTRARVRLPLAAACVGSAAAFGWGGLLGALGTLARSAQHPSSAFMVAVYAAETAAGLLALGAGLAGLPAANRPGAGGAAGAAGTTGVVGAAAGAGTGGPVGRP
ncbi:hypothetical protein AB0O31_01905 [Kitasatospora cineracea]|uniref:hypothetical protein n=1 Tax=Kitasatospora cineracea TaxID=88074 RepID=UPI0034311AF8